VSGRPVHRGSIIDLAFSSPGNTINECDSNQGGVNYVASLRGQLHKLYVLAQLAREAREGRKSLSTNYLCVCQSQLSRAPPPTGVYVYSYVPWMACGGRTIEQCNNLK
jgi:hypothetical protein